MKAILTFCILFFVCDITFPNNQQNETVKLHKVIRNDSILCKTDTICDYSTKINGPSNSVNIKKDKSSPVSPNSDFEKKYEQNGVEINGENNTVSISQQIKGGKVIVKQKGNNNQINISQSNQGSEE